MQRVAIAGISGYLGFKLAHALEQDPAVSLVLGLDRRPPPTSLSKLIFVQHDARTPFDGLLLEHWIDTLVYLVPRPGMTPDSTVPDSTVPDSTVPDSTVPDPQRRDLTSVALAIHRCGLHRVLLVGCSTEKTELQPRLPQDFVQEHPEVKVVTVCLSPVVGDLSPHPGVAALRRAAQRMPFLPFGKASGLGLILVPGRARGLRFCHESDAIAALRRLISDAVEGVVQVGPTDEVSWWELGRALSRPSLPVPRRLLRPLERLNRALQLGLEIQPPPDSYWERLDLSLQALAGLTPLDRDELSALDGQNLSQRMDFHYQFSTREALLALSRTAESTPRSVSD